MTPCPSREAPQPAATAQPTKPNENAYDQQWTQDTPTAPSHAACKQKTDTDAG